MISLCRDLRHVRCETLYLLRGMCDPERLTEPELQSCSVPQCGKAVLAVIEGRLLCFEHATLELERRRSADDSQACND